MLPNKRRLKADTKDRLYKSLTAEVAQKSPITNIDTKEALESLFFLITGKNHIITESRMSRNLRYLPTPLSCQVDQLYNKIPNILLNNLQKWRYQSQSISITPEPFLLLIQVGHFCPLSIWWGEGVINFFSVLTKHPV